MQKIKSGSSYAKQDSGCRQVTRVFVTGTTHSVYRWEYKKRFDWIKTKKIEQDAFYARSEKARQEKAKCDAVEFSFQHWLEKFIRFTLSQ